MGRRLELFYFIIHPKEIIIKILTGYLIGH